MGDYDTRRAVGERICEDFSWVDLGLVDEADGNDANGDDFLGAV